MGLISNKIHRSNLQPGDHIYSFRKWKSYSHHGIFVEADKVIHYTKTRKEEPANKLRRRPACGKCGFDRKVHRGVVISCLDCFLSGYELYRFDYEVPYHHFLFKRSGTCSTGSCDDPAAVISRATDLLNSQDGFGDYNLFENNCECFAIYCKTGKHMSEQACSAKLTIRAVAQAVLDQNSGRLLEDVRVHDPENYMNLKEKIDKLIPLPINEIIAILGKLNANEEEVEELETNQTME
ncbi:PREDICTED: uncharacterized protein LOC101304340 [Fragaria vesca subsp. vesca]|uniref:uncharacterized protein LOC101304340 n=1 Tax=Fragaria vesca subsp. vesca TaxID=101020 RepID=UPI0002C2F6D6|nr:PREDICTED: uncharacterized protein LOC101304340 [Fragaria vesca subsp. vesca]